MFKLNLIFHSDKVIIDCDHGKPIRDPIEIFFHMLLKDRFKHIVSLKSITSFNVL